MVKIQVKSRELYSILDAASSYNDESVLKLREDGIMQEMVDSSNTAAFASLTPEKAFETYGVDEEVRIGVRVDEMLSILNKNDDIVTMDLDVGQGVHRAIIRVDGREYSIPLIDVDSVSQIPDNIPTLNLPIKIYGEVDWLLDFVTEAQDYIYNGSQGNYWISAQEGLLYLFSKRDDYEMNEKVHWEDFDDYEINWSRLKEDQQQSMGILDPSEKRRAETLMSIDLTKAVGSYGDKTRVEMGHGMPLKVVSQTEEGTKFSWILPPRFPKEGQRNKVPERVFTDRSVS